MRRYRLRVGIRLALLLMALACVLSAYLRATLDLRREKIRSELITLDDWKFYWEQKLKYAGAMKAQYLSELQKVNAEIAEKQQQVGRPSEREE